MYKNIIFIVAKQRVNFLSHFRVPVSLSDLISQKKKKIILPLLHHLYSLF